ncbi:hypothetical protein B7P43_G11055 [Cryptotermes secundus]|uniref:Uncharacterized protein n=1 Tax=Cryptotermes secundus TaxID=105785 RepID=A0A2J7RF99_9NEOP|nr:hypothetical protein B7P43_G11055 [Cryptotermes secundus]
MSCWEQGGPHCLACKARSDRVRTVRTKRMLCATDGRTGAQGKQPARSDPASSRPKTSLLPNEPHQRMETDVISETGS